MLGLLAGDELLDGLNLESGLLGLVEILSLCGGLLRRLGFSLLVAEQGDVLREGVLLG